MLGSGWLGLALAKHFTSHNYTIKVSTRQGEKQQKLIAQGFDCYLVDTETQTSISDFLSADTLIVNITNKNLAAYQYLIEGIEHSPIQHVLFVSSSSVYQNINDWVAEDNKLEDENSVLFQIENAFKASSGFKTSVIRFSGLIGPNRHPGRFFRGGKQVKQGDTPVNLIHLADCIGIINSIIEQDAWGQTFNGCADTHPIKRDFYPFASQQLGYPVPEFIEEESLHYKIVNNAKVKQALNYRFIYPDLMQIPQEAYE
ncbi:MAG TPA: SDR family NAD(P)-dependent oxidoreductase [Methylophaga aminisulfidivorans]|uniref:SDR family NAD(P)-dependent oxidoreductase n=1 Tax=Methylophaga aminisulfidivorans TaxID=230105 RepID=A0A7C1VWR2_9GAMM|nr:SDR family NAD(P)-dependent oxidoreductase [Methylophaga aminisulfidivorans]